MSVDWNYQLESYFHKPIYSFDHFLGSKLNFLVDFIRNKKCKNGLKYFARITFTRKEN